MSTTPMLSRVTCPQCWNKFQPEDVLWISEHQDLFGIDNRVPNAQLRFLPSRFSPQGEAIDPRGFPCHKLACPKCHLEVARPMLELATFFLSIIGSPGSGKSYFLAAMARQLRRTLPLKFSTAFADADATFNMRLKEYEQSLFANARPDQVQELLQLVKKTDVGGDGYADVRFGTQSVRYALPYLFTMRLQDNHPNLERRGYGRTVCLYDNAGESYLPGQDSAAAPVTRHLAESSMLFFVFDPLQDSRFRRLDESLNEGIVDKSHLGSQEGVFEEAATRIRRFAGLSSSQKYNRPVTVIVTKCDRWLHLLFDEPRELTAFNQRRTAGEDGTLRLQNAVDVGTIDRVSQRVRQLLVSTSTEI
ncbi:MAG: hypothetical protein C0506_16565, partial [Anaerolinea sp.]|nr:hypothetical protein [Anaerolinea sp.]